MNKTSWAFVRLILSMIIFGSIGLFVRNIALPSGVVAMTRAVIGTVVLLLISLFRRKPLSFGDLRRNLPVLLLSGTALGFNWLLLFESYRFTSVAVSTLCYYTAPIMVLLLSPFILKETVTAKKLLCVIPVLVGMVFISGVSTSGNAAFDIKGILLGLAAAVLYASVVMLNKANSGIPAFDRTLFQLGTAALVLTVYHISASALPKELPDPMSVCMLLIVGILHTGLAYYLYFGAMAHLKGQTIAIVSYVDPVVAVAVSVFLLQENTSWYEMLGAVLILGGSVFSELSDRRKKGVSL